MDAPNVPTPFEHFLNTLVALQWPLVVFFAFWIGYAFSALKVRVLKAEKNVQDLIERHLPHVHAALADIKNRLDVISARLSL